MSDHELMAWLGPVADDLTSEQVEQVAVESREIDQRYPHPDDQHLRDAALSAVVQHVLGETTAQDADHALRAARRAEREAYAAALQIAVMLTRGGTPKAAAARRAGVDRMSLLKALGER